VVGLWKKEEQGRELEEEKQKRRKDKFKRRSKKKLKMSSEPFQLPSTPPRLFKLCEEYVFKHLDRYIQQIPKVNQDIKERLWKYALLEHLVDDYRLPFFLDTHSQRDLDLGGCEKITDNSLLHIAKKYPSLQIINLSFCINITAEGIKALVHQCNSLHTISLCHCSISDQALFHIASSLPNLKSLSLSGCQHISDAAVQKLLAKCSDLQYLDISHCKTLSSSSIKAVAGLSSLLHLDLSWCSDAISESSIQKLAKGCHKLQYLGVADSKISDSVLQKILQGCKLAALDVSFCTGLFQSDKTVKYLANITRLNAAGCNISESTAMKMLEAVPELRELDVSYNDLLKEQWLLNLTNTPKLAINLKVLNVNFCKSVTSKVIQALLQARFNLTVYSFCPQ